MEVDIKVKIGAQDTPLEDVLNSLHTNLVDVLGQAKELQQASLQTNNSLNGVKEQIQYLEGADAEKTKEIQHISTGLTSFSGELHSTKQVVADLEAWNKTLENTLHHTNNELESSKDRIQRLEQYNTKKSETISNIEAEVKTSKKSIANLENSDIDKTVSIQQINHELGEAQTQIQHLQELEAEKVDAFKQITSDLDTVKTQVQDLEKQSTLKDATIAELADNLRAAKTQIQHLEECVLKKTTSLFHSILEGIGIRPKQSKAVKEISVNADEK